MKKALLAALTAVMLAACSSTPISPTGNASVEDRTAGGAQTVKVPPVSSVAAGNLGDGPGVDVKTLKNVPTKRSVYFDYDSFSIKDEYKAVVEQHARFLVANPRVKMLVQGNTDERGSREYNIALGQKRADVVKKAILVLGGREDQVEAVSLGEENPKNTGHDEAAYAENRRADVLYSGEF